MRKSEEFKEIIEKGLDEAKTLMFYGIPVTELDKDELMVMALFFMKMNKREQDYHTKSFGLMADMAKFNLRRANV